MPVYKVLLSWYRYARMLATCYYTRSPYCCCVATIVHTGDQLPDPRLVSRALISREARVSHFAPRETTNSCLCSTPMRLSHSRRAAEVGAARRVVRRLLHVPPAMHAVAPVVESLPLPADAAQAAADLSCVASAPASSVASAAMPPLALYWPPDLLLLAVDGIHQTLGLPWWAAIAASTLLARAALLIAVVLLLLRHRHAPGPPDVFVDVCSAFYSVNGTFLSCEWFFLYSLKCLWCF